MTFKSSACSSCSVPQSFSLPTGHLGVFGAALSWKSWLATIKKVLTHSVATNCAAQAQKSPAIAKTINSPTSSNLTPDDPKKCGSAPRQLPQDSSTPPL